LTDREANPRTAFLQLRSTLRALALVWTAARPWMVAWVIVLVLQGLLPAASVHLTRILVDALVSAVGSRGDWATIRPGFVPAGLLAGTLLLAEILRAAGGWIRSVQAELVTEHINSLIHAKSVAIDLAFYDLPEYYDHLHRARAEAGYRPVVLLENMGSLLQNSVTLGAMLVILAPYGLWVPAALLVSTLPALFVVIRYTLRQHAWRRRTTRDERRTWYYDWLLTARDSAAEIRLFNLGEDFREAYRTLRSRLCLERLRMARAQTVAQLPAGGAALLVAGASVVWVAWRAVRGLATLGDLALFYQAFGHGQGLMRSLLENVGQIYSNGLFLGDLFQFLELEPADVSPPRPATLTLVPATKNNGTELSIRFRDVTFHYPGSGRKVLDNVSLFIPAGKIAAIMGTNGAGKSTLIKLLCRFYDPESGNVELAGVDVRDLSLADLRARISVLFQPTMQYNMTVRENIAIGNGHSGEGSLRSAAAMAGADDLVRRLPRGYESMLGTWFDDGTDLSAGEWQRIGLARALLRPAPVLVLDEPTSAMDPWAESSWVGRFRAAVAGRTGLLITHRFNTARCADMIYVMDEGRIVECGGHAELLAKGGRYYAAWMNEANVG